MWEWHLLRTKPAKELVLESNLRPFAKVDRNESIWDVYCPMRMERRDKHVYIHPLFNRYIFLLADLNDGDALALVKRAFGLESIPKIGGCMLKVDREEVKALKSLEIEGYVTFPNMPSIKTKSKNDAIDIYTPGTLLEVIGKSVFAGKVGTFEKYITDSDLLRMMLESSYRYTIDIGVDEVKRFD